MRRIPTYNISGGLFARAIAAGMGSGAAIGFAWWWFNPYGITYIFYGVPLGLIIGYAIGEAVALATNRRAGPPLQAIAVGGVVLAYLLRCGLMFGVDGYTARFVFDLGSSVAVVLAGFIAAGRLR